MIDNKKYPSNILTLENAFLSKLRDYSEQAMTYDDEMLQTLARSLIPMEKLEQDTTKTLGLTCSKNSRDQLLLRLLRWFKVEFFKWVDVPPCPTCNGKPRNFESPSPSVEELSDGARRVEGYWCDACNKLIRFPRYNNPRKLLETRCGRCGEWANCFTLCSQALGFDSRFVVDFTDHVWTEVWSDEKGRWLHCDPCENVCDRPLIYEHGWNKKLTYVMAFSPTQIMDVTWRYTAKFEETLDRRLECRESHLLDFLDNFNRSKMKSFSEERRNQILKQMVSEISELLCSKKTIREGEDVGRTSGSLQWRTTRGEVGKTNNHFVLIPEPQEIRAKEFLITYNSASDTYERPFLNRTVSGWANCTFSTENVFRKEEVDWGQVYLSRTEHSSYGEISWKIDLNMVKLEVAMVEIHVEYRTFENGQVRFNCCLGDSCFLLKNGLNTIEDGIQKAKEIVLSAKLEGGNGDCAWQHAQLFRVPLNSPSSAFKIKINFK